MLSIGIYIALITSGCLSDLTQHQDTNHLLKEFIVHVTGLLHYISVSVGLTAFPPA